MANKRVAIMDLKLLVQLKLSEKSNRQISQIIGRSRNTINDYVQLLEQTGKSWESLNLLDSKELKALIDQQKELTDSKKDKRYEELVKHKDTYLNDYKRPGATYQTIWQIYRTHFPDGYGYTQFKRHLKSFTKQQDYSMPMHHKYGDKLFIDFTGKKLSIVDPTTGEETEVEVFIGILGGSNYTYVEACASQRMEDFFRCTANCLEYMGGVPQALVPDNLKSAVTKASNYEAIINRQYKSLALHYNTVVFPTRAVKPKDKALVEGAVKLVYQRIFFLLSKQTFFSLSELNEQIRLLLKTYNETPFYKQEVSRMQRFLLHEKSLLKALPVDRFEPKEVNTATVQKNAHVWLKEHYYSVPHTYMGKKVQVHYNNRVVEVYYNLERVAIHQRSHISWAYTTIKDHMPSHHQFVMDWSAEKFTKWGQRIGDSVGAYIEKVLQTANYPEQAYKSCMGILNLGKTFTNERLEKACLRGLTYEKYSYRTIKRILQAKLDQLEEQPDCSSQSDSIELPPNEHLRGSTYYEGKGE